MITKEFKGENSRGKNVLILGGIHGDEITPIYQLSKMIKENTFNLSKINKLTVLNAINMDGIRNKQRGTTVPSSDDLNRALSSNKDQTDVIKILKDYFTRINIDAVIDIHSSPSCTEFALVDIDEYTTSIKDWCDAAGVVSTFRYSGANTIKRYCLSQNKLALTLEVNKLNRIDYGSGNILHSIINRLLDTIDDYELVKTKPNVVEMVDIKTYSEGFVESHVELGSRFEEGEVLCEILDLNMKVVNEIVAPFKGIVLCDNSHSYVTRGDILFLVQPL